MVPFELVVDVAVDNDVHIVGGLMIARLLAQEETFLTCFHYELE
jgi:hypothetical protein